MNEKQAMHLSKFLSLVLRHKPQAIGIVLDSNGWTRIDELISHGNRSELTRANIDYVVETSDKQRFSISSDGQKIRANQGHSIDVDLALSPSPPPTRLYHGTAIRFLEPIREQGLKSMSRHHVHLSKSPETAVSVGARHGKPVVLTVDAQAMSAEGFKFFVSANGVWLCEHIPTRYIEFP